jgi:TatD DNase family protein
MIDFHCHLDLYPDPYGVARDCESRNLYVLSVTNTPSAWTRTAAIAGGSDRIWTALGLHPQIAHERKGELFLFDQLLPQTQYVGEIGLDGSPELKRHWSDQKVVFTRILDACARAGGRILSIHSRRASTPVLDALEMYHGVGTPILHWFSGSQHELARAVEIGCWFSVGLAMLGGKKGRSLVSNMPRDRVLTESDGPFTRLDGNATLPWDTERAMTAMAELWVEPVTKVRDQLLRNLFRLTKSETNPSI